MKIRYVVFVPSKGEFFRDILMDRRTPPLILLSKLKIDARFFDTRGKAEYLCRQLRKVHNGMFSDAIVEVDYIN